MIACYSHLRRLFLIIIEIFEKKRRKAPFCSIELCSRQSLNRRKKVFFIFYEINGKGNEFARVNEQISIEVQRQFSPMKKNQPKEIEFFFSYFQLNNIDKSRLRSYRSNEDHQLSYVLS